MAGRPRSRPAPTGGQRGRPREEDFDERILREGFVELAHGGISHFSVSAVARRAGVAKGSIYLRWPSRDQLILDASMLLVASIRAPAPGSIAAQLGELADQWAAVFAHPLAIELLLRVGADRDQHPDLYRVIFDRVQGVGNRVVQDAVRAAQERGEVDPAISPTLATRLFVGPMFVEALAHTPAGAISREFRAELVQLLLRALAPLP
jgi:AcrR family transcriptional regulator